MVRQLLILGCVALVTASAAAASGRAQEATSGKIAFVSGRDGNPEIYVMNADGTDLRRVTNSPKFDGFPGLSPDDRKLLFYSQRSPNGDVWVMNADGSGQRNLTRSPAHDSATAQGWSPDGTKIVFDSDRAGPQGNSGLYVMNADGSDPQNVTKNPGTDDHAVWSPNEKQIAFDMHPDGTSLTDVTDSASWDSGTDWGPRG